MNIQKNEKNENWAIKKTNSFVFIMTTIICGQQMSEIAET